jgi:hypothetical protein
VMIWLILAVVFMAGCIGGLISGVFMLPVIPANENRAKAGRGARWLRLSYHAGKCQTEFPRLGGDVLLGGVAAVVFWCLYGPFTGATIIGPPPSPDVSLSIGQLASCLLIGMGGAGFLLTEARRRCSERGAVSS